MKNKKNQKNSKTQKKQEKQESFDLSDFGRYSMIVGWLREYFSEYALVKNKLRVYLYWMKFCIESKCSEKVDKNVLEKIDKIYNDFSYETYTKIKKEEKLYGNLLQAMEDFIETQLKKANLTRFLGMVSMDCSIENINDIAYALMMATMLKKIWMPTAEELMSTIADTYLNTTVYMLAEDEDVFDSIEEHMLAYAYRSSNVLKRIATLKIGPISETILDKSSPVMSKKFINEYLGLELGLLNENVEHDDYVVELAKYIEEFNNILLRFNKDMKSIEKLKLISEFKFESCEDDITISNLYFTSQTTMLSMAKRIKDLTDFHSQKKMVLAFGHSLQAIQQTMAQIKLINAKNVIDEETENPIYNPKSMKEANFDWN